MGGYKVYFITNSVKLKGTKSAFEHKMFLSILHNFVNITKLDWPPARGPV